MMGRPPQTSGLMTMRALMGRTCERAPYASSKAGRAPQAGGWGLRFALAFLHAQGGGKRRPNDEFWRAVRASGPDGHSRRVGRRAAEFALIPILCDIGIEPLPATLDQLRRRVPLTPDLHVRRGAVAMMVANERKRELGMDYERELLG